MNWNTTLQLEAPGEPGSYQRKVRHRGARVQIRDAHADAGIRELFYPACSLALDTWWAVGSQAPVLHVRFECRLPGTNPHFIPLSGAPKPNSTQVEGYLQDKVDHLPHPRKLHRVAGAGGNIPHPDGILYTPRQFTLADEDIHQVMMTYSFEVPDRIASGIIKVDP